MRENLILVRMDDHEKDILIGLARYHNISKADVVRMLVMKEYREINEACLEYDRMSKEESDATKG